MTETTLLEAVYLLSIVAVTIALSWLGMRRARIRSDRIHAEFRERAERRDAEREAARRSRP